MKFVFLARAILYFDFFIAFLRAKTSLYAWIPDLTLLFFLQLCESAVDNLRSPPDVFIVPVSLRK